MATSIVKPSQKLTLQQFVEQLPDEDGRYELVNGEIVKILATRQHEDVADFIRRQFDKEVERLSLNYRVSDKIMIGTLTKDGQQQGRYPDVSVVKRTIWEVNRFAYSMLLEPLQLAVEIVSTNWEDDYIDKLDEYQRMGISEYWIVEDTALDGFPGLKQVSVDYLALGSRKYLGNPKVPTVFVYLLDENGVYQHTAYQHSDRIVSRTFPELALTTEQVLKA